MQPNRSSYGARARSGVGVALTLGLLTAAGVARAQDLNCSLVAADVQAEQPTALPMAGDNGRYTLEGRTAEQVIQQWATVQDPDPEACRLLRAVEHRLAAEDAFARQQCPEVLPGLRSQADLAKGEATVVCKGRE